MEQMLVLVMMAAFEPLTPLLYVVPRGVLVAGRALKHVQREVGAAGLFGSTSVRTILNIILDALNTPANFRSTGMGSISNGGVGSRNPMVKAALRSWCTERCLNSKYVARALQLFIELAQSILPSTALFVRKGVIREYPPLQALLHKLRPICSSALDEAAAEDLVNSCLSEVQRFLPERYVHLEQATFAHVAVVPLDPGAGPRLLPVVRANGAFMELAQPSSTGSGAAGITSRGSVQGYPPFPLYAGAMVCLWRKKFRKEAKTLQIYGIFGADLRPLFASARDAGAPPLERGRAAAELASLAATDRGRQLLLDAGMAPAVVALTTPGVGGSERDNWTLEPRAHAATAVARLASGSKSMVFALTEAGACSALVNLLEDAKKYDLRFNRNYVVDIRFAVASAFAMFSEYEACLHVLQDSGVLQALVALAVNQEEESGDDCSISDSDDSRDVQGEVKELVNISIAAIARLAASPAAAQDLVAAGVCTVLIPCLSNLPAAARQRLPETLVSAACAVRSIALASLKGRQALAQAGA